jgi:hypothetical protein
MSRYLAVFTSFRRYAHIQTSLEAGCFRQHMFGWKFVAILSKSDVHATSTSTTDSLRGIVIIT